MHAGGALADALAYLYLNAWDLDGAIATLHGSYGSYIPAGHFGYLTVGHLENVLRTYAETRSPDEFEILTDASRTMVEQPLTTILSNGEAYGGKPDMLIRLSGGVYVLDHKCTSAYVTTWWAEKWAFSHQMRGYALLCKALTGEDVAGAIINGVYMGEMENTAVKWKTRKSIPSGLFGPFDYTASMLEETEEWVRQKNEEIVYRRAMQSWPQRGEMRPCSSCEFNQVCRAAPALRESIIRREYVTREISGVLASGADMVEAE